MIHSPHIHTCYCLRESTPTFANYNNQIPLNVSNFCEPIEPRNPCFDQNFCTTDQRSQINSKLLNINDNANSVYSQDNIYQHRKTTNEQQSLDDSCCPRHIPHHCQYKHLNSVHHNQVPGLAYPAVHQPHTQPVQEIPEYHTAPVYDDILEYIKDIIEKSELPLSKRGRKPNPSPKQRTLNQRKMTEKCRKRHKDNCQFAKKLLYLDENIPLHMNIKQQFPEHFQIMKNIRNKPKPKSGKPRTSTSTEAKYYNDRNEKVRGEEKIIVDFIAGVISNWERIAKREMSIQLFCMQ